MAEYIEREALLKAYRRVPTPPPEAADFDKAVWEMLRTVPAADVARVRHGWWVQDRVFEGDIICAMCGKRFNVYDNDTEDFDFCPKCGARMEI